MTNGKSNLFPLFDPDTFAQNQSFAQKGIGTKYKTIHIWSYPQNLASPCYYYYLSYLF